MTYDARSRDRYRAVVNGVSGAVAASVLIGTGALAGEAAQTKHAEDAAAQARRAEELATYRAQQAAYQAALEKAAREAQPEVIWKKRPHRTRITTRYVTGSAAGAGVTVRSRSTARGSGGTTTSGGRSSSTTGSRGGSGGGGAVPTPAPPPPPPPPASSGS